MNPPESAVHLAQTHPPLSRVQQQILIGERIYRESPSGSMALLTWFDERVDPQRFVAAVHSTIEAHHALRTIYPAPSRAGDPVRPVVLDAPPMPTELVTLAADQADEWIRNRARTPLHVDQAVYDSVLIDCDGRHGWLMTLHHVASDATSAALVFHTAGAFYAGETPAGSDHRDVLAAAADQPPAERWLKAENHWSELAIPEAKPELYRTATQPNWSSSRSSVALDQATLDQLDERLNNDLRALSYDLGLAAVLATAIAVFRHRLSDTRQVTIGLPVHNRDQNNQHVVGCCIDIFPLVIDIDSNESFRSLHRKTLRALLMLLAKAQPGTTPAQKFDVVLNVLSVTFGGFAGIGTRTESVFSEALDTNHGMRVQSFNWDNNDHPTIELDVNHGVADADQRALAGQHFSFVMAALVADPDASISSFVLATDHEQSVIDDYNKTVEQHSTPVSTVVHDLRAALANRTSTALVGEHSELSGQNLWARAEQLADWLRVKGIGPGKRVGIRMRPDADAVVAIYGVLASGAAFVPLDPEYPDARLDYIRSDCGIALELDALPADHELDAVEPATTPRVEPALDDLAYVIYTSGSTGQPKGVPITHLGLQEYLAFATASYPAPGQAPTVALFSSLSFDLTITSLFMPVLAGGTIRCHPSGGLRSLREIVDDRAVTMLKATPSHLELLVRMATPETPIDTLIVGGESFTRSLAERLRVALGPDLRIFNEYGPTEAVVGCMIHRYDPDLDTDPQVPIGRPAPAAKLYVLDHAGQLAPLGVEGELFLRRPGMTNGYLERPELNAERFVERPAICDERLYASGDRVRLDHAGLHHADKDHADKDHAPKMIYLGRMDEQLKVQGVRLEPGEVEQALLEHPAVMQVAVRPWRAQDAALTGRRCERCGVATNVPEVELAADGICTTCHQFEAISEQTKAYFRTPVDLSTEIDSARGRATGDHDILHLLSGGKDSTYALYRLVDAGARVRSMTLDNGFISEHAIKNAQDAADRLGVPHEVVSTPAMNEIFRDSLEQFSNVCNGCYKALYTLAINRADSLGIPLVSTGLSRGQLFETRLTPGQFSLDRFDVGSIDDAVLAARKVYHRTDDAVSRLLDVSVFETDEIFERVKFLDFYRYVDVELEEMLDYLETRTPWRRPADTGRSTNCLINVAGIAVHQQERGFHNYAMPYAWDVRLGHKTRHEATDELEDEIDDREVTRLLAEIGYEPKRNEVLTAWFVSDVDIDADELRALAAAQLPSHSVPAGFARVESIPLTPNGKVATDLLPAPTLRGTNTGSASVEAATDLEATLADMWATMLDLDTVGVTDDFFALGGTSLRALEMIVWVAEHFETHITEAAAFEHRTIRELANEIERILIAEIEQLSDSEVSAQLDQP